MHSAEIDRVPARETEENPLAATTALFPNAHASVSAFHCAWCDEAMHCTGSETSGVVNYGICEPCLASCLAKLDPTLRGATVVDHPRKRRTAR